MAWRSGSLSRSLLTTVRSSSRSSSPPLPRLRPPPLTPPRVQSRRLSFASPAPREEWKRRVMQRTFKHPKGSENDASLYLKGCWISTFECKNLIWGGDRVDIQ